MSKINIRTPPPTLSEAEHPLRKGKPSGVNTANMWLVLGFLWIKQTKAKRKKKWMNSIKKQSEISVWLCHSYNFYCLGKELISWKELLKTNTAYSHHKPTEFLNKQKRYSGAFYQLKIIQQKHILSILALYLKYNKSYVWNNFIVVFSLWFID